jgi:hypothetical protein
LIRKDAAQPKSMIVPEQAVQGNVVFITGKKLLV